MVHIFSFERLRGTFDKIRTPKGVKLPADYPGATFKTRFSRFAIWVARPNLACAKRNKVVVCKSRTTQACVLQYFNMPQYFNTMQSKPVSSCVLYSDHCEPGAGPGQEISLLLLYMCAMRQTATLMPRIFSS